MSVTNAIADASMELRAGVRGRIPSLINYLAIAFQFGLFLVLVDQYDLISTAFKHLGVLAWVGWSLHYFLPQKYRLAWFVLLSLAGIEVVFGFNSSGQWSADGLTQGAWIIALGLGLIALCNLPGPFAARIAVVAAVGGLLSLARAGVISVPWSTAIWPIFGSMFMFRVIVYLHQRRHEKQKPKLLETLGYFFKEDLCAEPVTVAKQLFAFANMTWDAQTERYIADSMSSTKDTGYYGLAKDPLRTANKWHDELEPDDIAKITAIARQSRAGRLFVTD